MADVPASVSLAAVDIVGHFLLEGIKESKCTEKYYASMHINITIILGSSVPCRFWTWRKVLPYINSLGKSVPSLLHTLDRSIHILTS